MILAVDAGNTNIVFGGVDEDFNISFLCRISTDTNKTDDEYAVQFKTLIDLNGVSPESFEGGIISSVVPQITQILKMALRKVTGKTPLVVGPGIKTGLNIMIDNPAQLGSDLAVGAVNFFVSRIVICQTGFELFIPAVDVQNRTICQSRNCHCSCHSGCKYDFHFLLIQPVDYL